MSIAGSVLSKIEVYKIDPWLKVKRQKMTSSRNKVFFLSRRHRNEKWASNLHFLSILFEKLLPDSNYFFLLRLLLSPTQKHRLWRLDFFPLMPMTIARIIVKHRIDWLRCMGKTALKLSKMTIRLFQSFKVNRLYGAVACKRREVLLLPEKMPWALGQGVFQVESWYSRF